MRVYNTLSREKEEFQPLEDIVRIYSCGPTVYQYAHIGNMRTYVFMDLLRKVLQFNNYNLKHVMNITDVGHLVSDMDDGEDKLNKSARLQQKSPYEIAKFYTEVFMSDLQALHIQTPEIIVYATDHITEMIAFVEDLVNRGVAYETSDGIYFDSAKFEGYGKLSRLDLEEQQAGARVAVNTEKHNPADFALWKKAPPEHIMQWPSPWGQGFPGWHIECSTMAEKYLGDAFDIHTGGVDHIPVHHENEIAQSESRLGHQWVKYWMHGEFMMVNGGKMSKSLGNAYRLADLQERGFSPLHFRYFCLNAHYRNKLNFTWDAMAGAKTSYDRLHAAVFAHKNGTDEACHTEADLLRTQFAEAVNDDLNAPKALGFLWNMARLPAKSQYIYDLILACDSILSLGLEATPVVETVSLEADVEAMVEARRVARANKDWAASDRIRDELKAQGILIEDTAQGMKWRKA